VDDGADVIQFLYTVPEIAPQLVSQPQSQSVYVGQPATFTAKASGTLPLTYEWRLNDQTLEGRTNASLFIANAQTSDAGPYVVVVANQFGAATSAVATLSVASA